MLYDPIVKTYTVTAQRVATNGWSGSAYRQIRKGYFSGKNPGDAIARAVQYWFIKADGWTIKAHVRVKRAVRAAYVKLSPADEVAKGALREENDCTVTATVRLGLASYKDAHAAWELAGRRRYSGANVFRMLPKVAEMLHFSIAQIEDYEVRLHAGSRRVGTITVRAFCKQYPVGDYYITTRDHALAVRDGKLLDGAKTSDLSRLCQAYKIQRWLPAIVSKTV